MREIGINDFRKYPHYVYATAFLINGELADYKIQDRERTWTNRTFWGFDWEGEITEKDELTCKYNKILVNNREEHNRAFKILEDWLFDNFKIYKKSKLKRPRRDILNEIGYFFEKENEEFIIYKNKELTYPYDTKLSFNKKFKSFVITNELYDDRMWLDMKSLKIIYQKCKELGFLEEGE